MYILGINDGHLATAALLKDGKLVACVSEERFTRIKNQAGIPQKSIKFCLEQAKIKPGNVDLVVFGGKLLPPTTQNTKSNATKSSYNQIYSITKPILSATRHVSARISLLWKIEDLFYGVAANFLAQKAQEGRTKQILNHYKFDSQKITYLDHHLAHAHAALWSSGIKSPVLILTCDGEGDGLSASVNVYKNGKLERISKTSMTNSVGNFYRSVTKYLGMKPLEHEYKVMGLAAYVKGAKAQELFENIKDLIYVDRVSLKIKTKVNSQLFKMGYLDKIFEGYRFDYIAYAAQRLTEKVLTDWVKASISKTGIKNVALSGGVFMNVKANQKINDLRQVKKLFIMPSGGDESNAIGAAYWGYYRNTRKEPFPLDNLYLGPEYKTNAKLFKKANWKTSKPKNIEKKVAQLLAKGEVVARFKGRMEWGARALGNRSILADASHLGSVGIINKMIKNRDFWMPFAPVVMKPHHKKYLKNPKNISAPYMNITFDTTERGKVDLAAGTHQYDKSARPQIIDKKANPDYYNVLEEFSKITGRFGLLNTSFNLHGYPIVASPQDALEVFSGSALKFLALGEYLIEKKINQNS